jgi:hypothetical protein
MNFPRIQSFGPVDRSNCHTFCSWIAMAGASITEIQELAGHKTITRSARYPSPPRAAETRCSPTSKSALQSSRAPSTKNEIAARSAAISKISQYNTHAIRTDCTMLREAPPRGGIGECNRYGQRLGAGYADAFANLMIGGAILPSLLHQDPRWQGTLATGCLDITPFLDFEGSGRRLWPRLQSRGYNSRNQGW